jgi:hypothetical protein
MIAVDLLAWHDCGHGAQRSRSVQSSSPGSRTRGAREFRTMKRWRLRQRSATEGHPCGSSCSRESTSAASCSSPTPAAGRGELRSNPRPTPTGQPGRGRASLLRVLRSRVLGFARERNLSRGARGSQRNSGTAKSRARRPGLDFACVLMRSSSGRSAHIACTTVRSTFDAVADGDAICSNPRCAHHGGGIPSSPTDDRWAASTSTKLSPKSYPRDCKKG